MDSKIYFEMSLIEAIRGRCTSFMILTATVSEIFGGQTLIYFSSTCIDIKNSCKVANCIKIASVQGK